MTNFKVMLAHPVGKKEFDRDYLLEKLEVIFNS